MSIYHRQYFKSGASQPAAMFDVLRALLASHPSWELVSDTVPDYSAVDDPYDRPNNRVSRLQTWQISWDSAYHGGVVVCYFHMALMPETIKFAMSEGFAEGKLIRPIPTEVMNNPITPAADGSLGGDKAYELYSLTEVMRPDRTQKPNRIEFYGWWGKGYRYEYPLAPFTAIAVAPEIHLVDLPYRSDYSQSACFYVSTRGVYMSFSYGLPFQFLGFGTYDTFIPALDDPCPIFMFKTGGWGSAGRVSRMPYVQRAQPLNYAVSDALTTPHSLTSGALLGTGDRVHGQRAIMTRMMVRQQGKTDTHGAHRGLYANWLHADSHGGTVEVAPRLAQVEAKTKDATWKILGQRGSKAYLVNISAL